MDKDIEERLDRIEQKLDRLSRHNKRSYTFKQFVEVSGTSPYKLKQLYDRGLEITCPYRKFGKNPVFSEEDLRKVNEYNGRTD